MIVSPEQFKKLSMLGSPVILKPGVGIKLPSYTPGFIIDGDPETGYAQIYIPWAGTVIPAVPYDIELKRIDTCWCYKADLVLRTDESVKEAEKVG